MWAVPFPLQSWEASTKQSFISPPPQKNTPNQSTLKLLPLPPFYTFFV